MRFVLLMVVISSAACGAPDNEQSASDFCELSSRCAANSAPYRTCVDFLVKELEMSSTECQEQFEEMATCSAGMSCIEFNSPNPTHCDREVLDAVPVCRFMQPPN
jgi:hypothetical protein